MRTSYYERGQKRRNLKNPDHLSLILMDRREISEAILTPYSHTRARAGVSNIDGLVHSCRKRRTVGLFSSELILSRRAARGLFGMVAHVPVC